MQPLWERVGGPAQRRQGPLALFRERQKTGYDRYKILVALLGATSILIDAAWHLAQLIYAPR